MHFSKEHNQNKRNSMHVHVDMHMSTDDSELKNLNHFGCPLENR